MAEDAVGKLVGIMERLRGPDGCPWDLEQTHASLKQYLLEEAAELMDAIDEGDDGDIVDELGDVLLQVVFHCQIASETGRFSLRDVADHCSAKLVRRHPHVFGEGSLKTAAQVVAQWQDIKWEEAKKRDRDSAAAGGAVGGVPRHLPALHRAHRIQKKAAVVGFDWPSVDGVIDKIDEELDEVREAIRQGDEGAAAGEIGDLLFAVVNLSRCLNRPAEELLHATVKKFERRFARVEALLRERGLTAAQADLAQLDALWEQVKAEEREDGSQHAAAPAED